MLDNSSEDQEMRDMGSDQQIHKCTLLEPIALHGARFLEYYGYDLGETNRDRMVSDMTEMYGHIYSHSTIESFFSELYNYPLTCNQIVIEVQYLRNQDTIDLNSNIKDLTQIEDEEIDDEMDGIQKREDIVRNLYYKHFPYVTENYVAARYRQYAKLGYKLLRHTDVINLKNTDNNNFCMVLYHAQLCVEVYNFDKKRLSAMHQDFFDLNEKRGVTVRRGVCYQMIENCLTNPEDIKADIAKRELNVDKTIEIKDLKISWKIKTQDELTKVTFSIAKKVFLNFDVDSGTYDYAEEYSFQEIQHRVEKTLFRQALYEPDDSDSYNPNEADLSEKSESDSTL